MSARAIKRTIVLAVAVLGIAGPLGIALAGPPAKVDGAALYRQRCAMCHEVPAGARRVLAPDLHGVVGRRAASTAFTYSPALRAASITWTKPDLDRFLAAPGRMVPGTRMVIALTDAAQRKAVIDFLAAPRP